MPRPVATMLLVICTMLWGLAFIAQKTAMDSMGPMSFTGVRYIIGGLLVLPLALFERRRKGVQLSQRQWLLIAAMSLVFFLGSALQQIGLGLTTVTNTGFLTGLYVLFVPAIALIVLRVQPHPIIWIGVPIALVGIFYLNGGGFGTFNSGDGLVVFSAVFWAMHVLLLGFLARNTGLPIFVSAVSFLAAGVIALSLAFIFETPTMSGVIDAWIPIAYSAVMSTAVAFTLQAIGQQYVPAANAAIILSAESLFAALGGALLLGERLPPIGYAGAALLFCAIILVEAVPPLLERRARRRAAYLV